MKIIHSAAEFQDFTQKTCLAIGVFDGVHLGHQQVIRQTIDDARRHEARSVVVTFDRHPSTIVAPMLAPPAIHTAPQKQRAIAAMGVDALLVIRFDETFSRIPGEQFIRDLARDFGRLHSLCVGADFVFGHKRSGNVPLLRHLGQELGFGVHGLSAVCLDGEMVSSTRIRESVRSGQIEAASEMLGRACSISGLVTRGDGLGRKLGFPTANLDTPNLLLPPNGVYAVHASLEGITHRAVLNIGFRPTLQKPEPQLRVEAHILDHTRDLYDRELELIFVEKLREEQRFASIEALQRQIARDIEQAKNCF